jgi:hypothetical protein
MVVGLDDESWMSCFGSFLFCFVLFCFVLFFM